MNPLISVIVPAYNVRNYLPECLDSILAQTYRNLEIIVVDDGSTDGSGEMCDEYAAKDSRIKVIHQPKKNISVARNAGLDAAHGNYISFVDSDDFIHPSMLQTLKEGLEEHGADLSMISTVFLKSPERQTIYYTVPSSDGSIRVCTGRDLQMILMSDDYCRMGALWNKLYRRELVGSEKFEQTAAEDMVFNNRLFVRTQKAVLLSDALYYWRRREDSFSHIPIFLINQLKSHLMCHKELPVEDYSLRAMSLIRLYKNMLSNRYRSRTTPLWQHCRTTVKEVYKSTCKEFWRNPSIPFGKKVILLTFYHLPFTYTAFIRSMEVRAKWQQKRVKAIG